MPVLPTDVNRCRERCKTSERSLGEALWVTSTGANGAEKNTKSLMNHHHSETDRTHSTSRKDQFSMMLRIPREDIWLPQSCTCRKNVLVAAQPFTNICATKHCVQNCWSQKQDGLIKLVQFSGSRTFLRDRRMNAISEHDNCISANALSTYVM